MATSYQGSKLQADVGNVQTKDKYVGSKLQQDVQKQSIASPAQIAKTTPVNRQGGHGYVENQAVSVQQLNQPPQNKLTAALQSQEQVKIAEQQNARQQAIAREQFNRRVTNQGTYDISKQTYTSPSGEVQSARFSQVPQGSRVTASQNAYLYERQVSTYTDPNTGRAVPVTEVYYRSEEGTRLATPEERNYYRGQSGTIQAKSYSQEDYKKYGKYVQAVEKVGMLAGESEGAALKFLKQVEESGPSIGKYNIITAGKRFAGFRNPQDKGTGLHTKEPGGVSYYDITFPFKTASAGLIETGSKTEYYGEKKGNPVIAYTGATIQTVGEFVPKNALEFGEYYALGKAYKYAPRLLSGAFATVGTGQFLGAKTRKEKVAGVVIGGSGALGLVEQGLPFKKLRTELKTNYKPVEKTVYGEEIIRDVEVIPGEKKDITFIPERGGTGVKVQTKKILEETTIPIKKNPNIPRISREFKSVVEGAKDTGSIVSGSFSQSVLLKPEFTREFKDIDIISKNIDKTTEAVKNRNKILTSERKLITDSPIAKFEIQRVSYKGKQIADIDPAQYAEEGLIYKEGLLSSTIDVDGTLFLNPRIRLAAKLKQAERGKVTPKVAKDIKLLTGGKVDIEAVKVKPSIKGAYGYSKSDLLKIEKSMTGATTSARDLFKFMERDVKIKTSKEGGKEYGLFATPDVGGMPYTRKSRLFPEQKPAEFTDLISGNFVLKKSKPQIVYFPEPKGWKAPLKSSELEVVSNLNKPAVRGFKVGVTVIDGKPVDIISAKLLESESTTGKLGNLKYSLGKLFNEKKAMASSLKEVSIRGSEKPYLSFTYLTGGKVPLKYGITKENISREPLKYNRSKQLISSSGLKIIRQSESPRGTSKPPYRTSADYFIREPTPNIRRPEPIIPGRSPPPTYRSKTPNYRRPIFRIPSTSIYRTPRSTEKNIRIPDIGKKRKSRKSNGASFDLLLIKKGKPTKIASNLLREDALDLGTRKTLGNLDATFLLRKGLGPARDIITEKEFSRYSRLFRKPTAKSKYRMLGEEVFIQKQSKVPSLGRGRLTTRGERAAIQASRGKYVNYIR